jgi:hypothetical protein
MDFLSRELFYSSYLDPEFLWILRKPFGDGYITVAEVEEVEISHSLLAKSQQEGQVRCL